MTKHIFSIVMGIMSGLTWSIDTIILSSAVGSVFLITLLHDTGAFLINITGARSFVFRKRLYLGYVAGALGNLGFIGASMFGGAILGVITSSSMPIITYLFTGKYDLKKSFTYLLGAVILGLLSNVSGEIQFNHIVLLGLLCVVGWSYETIAVEKYAYDLPYDTITFMRMLVGIIVFLPIVLLLRVPVNFDLVPMILLAGMVGGISYRMWYYAILKLGAPIGNSLNLTYLIFTILYTSSHENKIWYAILGVLYLLIVFYIDKLNIQEA